jgi:methanogenic corrinoid protein MtbC1
MPTTVRPIRFDPALLSELEARSQRAGEDLSRVVNAAVDRYLHGEDGAGGAPAAQDGPDLAEAAVALTRALVAGDAREAQRIVDAAMAAGAQVIDVHCDLLTPALHEVGRSWAADEITIAQEHRATELAARLLGTIAPDRRPPPTTGRLAIVSGTPDEQHVLGSRMVADLLERAGWEVIALGAATPGPELLALAASECPDLVALSTSTAGRLPGVQAAILGLAAIDPRPLIAVGGPIYTPETAAFARDLGADVVADLRGLLAFVRRRLPPLPAA